MSKPTTNGTSSERSYFEQQRESLVRDIGNSMEQVLQNINKLNRNLEGIVAVGSEFSSVEALWSNLENVMGKQPEPQQDTESQMEDGGEETVTGIDQSK